MTIRDRLGQESPSAEGFALDLLQPCSDSRVKLIDGGDGQLGLCKRVDRVADRLRPLEQLVDLGLGHLLVVVHAYQKIVDGTKQAAESENGPAEAPD